MTEFIREQSLPVLVDARKDLTKSAESVKEDLRRYWDKEQVNAMLEQVTNYKDKMLLTFLWMSGVRITEAVSLKKGDIDFKKCMMTVRWLKSKKYQNRVVPLHPKLKDILEMYTAALNLEARVFPYTRQRAWQIFKKWTNGHPHTMRHSFAVNWLRCQGDLVILHRILGHSKIQTTMEYLKVVPVDQGKELIKISFD